jgi:hypothetical protein
MSVGNAGEIPQARSARMWNDGKENRSTGFSYVENSIWGTENK